jgi:hypothetical protein
MWRRRFAILNPVLVKQMLGHRVRRAVIPSWIVIEIKFDRCDCASPDIRTSPAASRSQEFSSDLEIRVFHLSNIAAEIPKYYYPKRELRSVARNEGSDIHAGVARLREMA